MLPEKHLKEDNAKIKYLQDVYFILKRLCKCL